MARPVSRPSRQPRARRRRDRVAGARADDARIGVSRAHARTSGAVGYRSSPRRVRRVRGARAPGRSRRADARRAVLHLARRHLGHTAARRAAARGGPRRSRATSARRQQHLGAGRDSRRARRASRASRCGCSIRSVVDAARWLDYLTDFSRLNRRMHNKSFTADNQVTIVGGRNVGDEYFGAGHDVLFVDLDVLAIGPVVNDVSRDFDRYWHSESAWPARRVLAPASAESIAGVTAAAARKVQRPGCRGIRERGAASAIRARSRGGSPAVRLGADAHAERRSGEGTWSSAGGLAALAAAQGSHGRAVSELRSHLGVFGSGRRRQRRARRAGEAGCEGQRAHEFARGNRRRRRTCRLRQISKAACSNAAWRCSR